MHKSSIATKLCPEIKIDVSEYLSDPLMVATGSSWRRILHQSGSPAAVPTNAKMDNHPDLEAEHKLLQLMASSPELFESTAMLLGVIERLLENKPVKCLDEKIEFARCAIEKAQKPGANQVSVPVVQVDREALIERYGIDSAWREAWTKLANHPTKRREKYPLQSQQEYIERRANLANERIRKYIHHLR
ncbi:hypothetical protein LMH73_010220 [Vibrio splendidus]|nr:hypothetical protein [Vibrio splendidus]MCC4882958.1 hypothetical protein [Vibrio splendidus]